MLVTRNNYIADQTTADDQRWSCFTYVSPVSHKKPHKCLIICNLWGFPRDSYRIH